MLRNNATLVQSSTKAQYEPVVVSNNGEVVVIYIAKDRKSGSNDINIQGYTTTPSTTAVLGHTLEDSKDKQKQLQGTFLKNNHLVLTWSADRKDGSGYGVYATILERNTDNNDQHNKDLQYIVVRDTYRVNTYTKSNQQSPSVATLSNGDFVIVWQSYGQDTNASRNSEGVFGQRYSQDGAVLGLEFQINDYTIDNQQRPIIKSLNSGKFIVVWQSFGQDGSANGIFAKLYSNDGTVIRSEFQINTYTKGNQENPSIAVLQNDNVVILWQSYEEDSFSYNIIGQIIDSQGQKVGSEFQVNEVSENSQDNASNHKNVNIISTAQGFVVTWQAYNQSKKGYDIYVKEYSHTGSVIKPEEQVNADSKYSQEHPVVASINDKGEYAIVWQGFGSHSYNYEASMQIYTGTQATPFTSQESSVGVVSTAAPFVPSNGVTGQSTSSSSTAPELPLGASSLPISTELSSESVPAKGEGNTGNGANAGNEANSANANIDSEDSANNGMSAGGIVGAIIGTLAALAVGGYTTYKIYQHWNKVANDVEALGQTANAPDNQITNANDRNTQEMNNIPNNQASLSGTPIVSPDGSPYNSPTTTSLSGSSPGSKFGSLDATPSTTNSIDMSGSPIHSVRQLFGSNEPIGNNEMLSTSSLPDQAFSAANIGSDNIGSNIVMGANVNPLIQDANTDTNIVG